MDRRNIVTLRFTIGNTKKKEHNNNTNKTTLALIKSISFAVHFIEIVKVKPSLFPIAVDIKINCSYFIVYNADNTASHDFTIIDGGCTHATMGDKRPTH